MATIDPIKIPLEFYGPKQTISVIATDRDRACARADIITNTYINALGEMALFLEAVQELREITVLTIAKSFGKSIEETEAQLDRMVRMAKEIPGNLAARPDVKVTFHKVEEAQ